MQLKFSGAGIDATLSLTGVAANDRIEINVTLNGNRARLDSDRRSSSNNGVEVQGPISALNLAAQSLQVAGQTVVVPATAVVRRGDRTLQFTDLKMGDQVKVKGSRDGSTVTATEVKIEERDDDDDDDDDEDDDRDDGRQTELSGTVSGLGGACPSITFTVRSTGVRTSSATEFRDACSRILNAARVEVRGTRDANGQILATRVELDDLKGPGAGVSSRHELVGPDVPVAQGGPRDAKSINRDAAQRHPSVDGEAAGLQTVVVPGSIDEGRSCD